eukprot:jgi/Hompol1/771/HPOL_001371-RA
MSKLYLRYKSQGPFGVIAAPGANVVCDGSGTLVYAPQLDTVGTIHIKQGIQVAAMREDALIASVCRLALSPDTKLLAAGYSDGSIRLWDTASRICTVTFNGHRAPVTALAFDALGTRLASGSNDTDIVLWDIVAETGMFRLRGHRDQITCLRFLSLNGLNHLISSSKDSLVKFWDLTAKHCVETLVTHRGEVWALDVHPLNELTLFTGAADGQIRVWNIDPVALAGKLDPLASSNPDAEQSTLSSAVTFMDVLERQSKERITTLLVHPSASHLAVQGTDRLVEIFKIKSDAELSKKLDKRKRKLKKKDTTDDSTADADVEIKITDRYTKHSVVRCTAKVASFSYSNASSSKTSGLLRIVCSLANNSIEAYEIQTDAKDSTAESTPRLVTTIDLAGHRSDIRSIALSSDDDLVMTGSNDLIKVWSTRSKQCLKSIPSGYILCSAFLPGNKHVVVGTKTGELQLFDLPSSTMLESIQAHSGPVWSLCVRADKLGIITGSQDKEVKFWDLRLKQDDEYSKLMSMHNIACCVMQVAKRATLVHTRTLKMSDDVLCVRQSPDGRLLAVALLDCTVKVFYYDTLKFSLSLYGHKLPVISMDISFDSTIIATASSDKSVKIWGLDFGDCHKSLHAHEDSVMACQFVWGTHYLFTASKDKTIKYWDADKFEQIMRLEGHQGEVWALAIAKYGNFVVSGSHDRSIRIWDKTDDQFTIEEERERELEERAEREAAALEAREDKPIGSGAPDADEDAANGNREVGAAGTKTVETLKAGEKIMEALAVWEKERGDFDKYESMRIKNPDVAPPPRSPFVIATGKPDMLPEEYVLHVVSQIRTSQLDEALLVLPFVLAVGLLKCVCFWIEKGWNSRLSTRILFYLIQTHHHELVSTRAIRTLLERIRRASRKQLRQERDRIGYNVAGIKFLQQEYENTHSSFFGAKEDKPVDPKSSSSNTKSSKQKRKRQIKVVS